MKAFDKLVGQTDRWTDSQNMILILSPLSSKQGYKKLKNDNERLLDMTPILKQRVQLSETESQVGFTEQRKCIYQLVNYAVCVQHVKIVLSQDLMHLFLVVGLQGKADCFKLPPIIFVLKVRHVIHTTT